MLNQISEFFSKGFGPLGKAKPMLHLLRVVESRLFLGRLLHVQANYAFLSLDVCFNCGWCLAADFCSRKGYLETRGNWIASSKVSLGWCNYIVAEFTAILSRAIWVFDEWFKFEATSTCCKDFSFPPPCYRRLPNRAAIVGFTTSAE